MGETYAEITDLIYVNYFVTKGIKSYCSGNIGFIQSADERIIMERIYLTLIPSSLLLAGSLLISAKTFAQVTSDNTLSTAVTSPDGSNFTIEGGNRPNGGGNLFHSFRDFSVPTNGSAVFNNASDIANIISRVTGGNFSSIDGLIKANGKANLFLINPAGIIFGQNARLDIGGSFFGSTADSLLFPEGEFSAVDTQAPPLLTVNIPIGLRFRDNPAAIINQSIATNNFGLPFGLQVNPGQTLALMGGDIFFAGGNITSPGSNIELGGLISTGIVTIEDSFKFSFPEGVDKADVSFNAAEINVASDGDGAITINAGNIEMEGNSQLLGGIAEGLGNANSRAGDINLNATGAVTLDNGSSIQNTVNRNAVGNSGDITLNTGSLWLNGLLSSISSTNSGDGDGGKITINANESITLGGFGSSISSDVTATAIGTGGDITLTTGSLALNGLLSSISSTNSGEGNGGKITINANESITLEGFGSKISSDITATGVGIGGDITLNTGSLWLNGLLSSISSTNSGEGNGGKITINANESITLEGFDSSISSDVTATAKGTGGDITLNTGNSIALDNNSKLYSSVEELGLGNAGEISINTQNLSLINGGQIFSITSGDGNAGNILIKATDNIFLNGEGGNKSSNSRDILGEGTFVSSIVDRNGAGNSGEISINTKNLSLINSAGINTSSLGTGDSGNITLNATESVFLTNESRLNTSIIGEGNSGNISIKASETISLDGGNIITGVLDQAIGNAGEINLEAKNISLTNGAQISSGSFAEGNGGRIAIKASETISLDGEKDGLITLIVSSVVQNGVGDAGDISLEAKNISLSNNARVSSAIFSKGNAGQILINVKETISLFGQDSNISSAVQVDGMGDAGDIIINTKNLKLNNGTQIFNDIFGKGSGGRILVNATETISLDTENTNGINSIISSGVQPTGVGNAGDISVDTKNLLLTKGGQIGSGTFGIGNAGKIFINATETISLDGKSTEDGRSTGIASTVEPGGVGSKGEVRINTRKLTLTNGGVVSSETFGTGDAGEIFIDATETISLNGEESSIRTLVRREAVGNGGKLTINTKNLSITGGAFISASTVGAGNAGDITVNAPQAIQLTDSSKLTVETSSEGKPGNITITTPQLTIGKDAEISATATETSTNTEDSGSIIINTSNLDLTGKLGVFAETQGAAPAGTLNIQANNNQPNLDIKFSDTAIISASTSGSGKGGDINLTAPEIISISGQGKIAVETTGSGNAGSINLTAEQLNISNQTEISASTSGTGSAGNITLIGTDSVLFDRSFITTIINAGAKVDEAAEPSNIIIKTSSLSLNNGTEITASTFGMGDAGNVNLEATENLSLNNSNISSAVATGAVGNGGNVKLDGEVISITDNSTLSTATDGEGNAGFVTVTADGSIVMSDSSASSAIDTQGKGTAGIVEVKAKEIVFNNSSLSSSSAGVGNANSVIIETPKNLSLNNTRVSSAVETGAIGNGGNVQLTAPFISVIEGSIISSSIEGEGNAGSVTVDASELILRDGATISASNFPSIESAKNPGTKEFSNVRIEANNLTLDNGRINAETQAGDNGNITLKVTEDIILRDNSLISAQALQKATGGNIDIDARFIIAFPSQFDGNDIIANAKEGQGGNINIKAEALFGIEERKATTGNRTNDIDASSQFGLSGQITITRPDFDPTSGLLELTEEVVDPSKLIAQNVCTQTANSEFVDIGKGGLPQNPEYVLAENSIEIELVAPVTASREELETSKKREEVKSSIDRKPPAQGWIWHENGLVELVAYNPDRKGDRRIWENHSSCQ